MVLFTNLTCSTPNCSRSGLLHTTPITPLLVVLGVFFIILFCFQRWRDEQKRLCRFYDIPGPWALPFLGNLLNIGIPPHLGFACLHKKYGDIYRVFMGQIPVVVLNNHELVEAAFVHQAEAFGGRPMWYTSRLISRGKSMLGGDMTASYLKQKRVLGKVMRRINRKKNTSANLNDHVQMFISNITQTKGKPFRPHAILGHVSASFIATVCYGQCAAEKVALKLFETVTAFCKFIATFPVDILPFLRVVMPWKIYEFKGILREMEVVRKQQTQDHESAYSDDVVRDVTDMLIRVVKKEGLPEPEKRQGRRDLDAEHIMVLLEDLIGAGLDTTLAGLDWAVAYLVVFPKCQGKLRQELKMSQAEDLDDYSKTPYLQAFIYETLRFSSFLPMGLPHKTTRDCELDGYFIPADTLVFANMWQIHKDPRVWERPEEFQPERFLTESGSLDQSQICKVSSFSVGLRRCMGRTLALQVMSNMLSNLVTNFCLTSVSSIDISKSREGLILKPLSYTISAMPV